MNKGRRKLGMKVLMGALLLFLLVGCSQKEEEEVTPVLAWQPTVVLEEPVNLDDTLTLTQIAEGAILIEHRFPWSSNSLLVEQEDASLVWIDTPCTPEATRKVLDWIYSTYGADCSMIAFNTGYHFDNLGGNETLAQENISIYASDLTGKLITDQGETARATFLNMLSGKSMEKEVYEELKYAYPCAYIAVEEGKEHSVFIKSQVEYYYPGKTHTPDNGVVYIEDRGILFGGCMIRSEEARDLGNTAEADIAHWSESLARLEQKYPRDKVQVVVPGHGKAGTYDAVDHTKELLAGNKK